jgi:hypothetical protein
MTVFNLIQQQQLFKYSKTKIQASSPPSIQSRCYPISSFRPLKDGLQFVNIEGVKDAVHTWLHVHLKTFLIDGIRKLMDCSGIHGEAGGFC